MGRKQLKAMIGTIILMALVSAGLLLLLTVITYNANLDAKTAQIAVKAVYVLSCLAGGFFIGRIMKEKKFLWGLCAGGLYFLMLVVVSVAMGNRQPDVMELLIALVLTAPAGMLGGMMS